MRADERTPENTIEDNWANVRRIWSGRSQDAARRSAVLRAARDRPAEALAAAFERILGRGVSEAAVA